MDPDESPERPKKPSRVLSAWHALRGEPVVPVSIRAEWVEVQWQLEAILDKLSAAAARLYTRDKAELKKALKRLEELESTAPADGDAQRPEGLRGSGSWDPYKVELSRRAMALRGRRLPALPVPSQNGVPNVPSHEGK